MHRAPAYHSAFMLTPAIWDIGVPSNYFKLHDDVLHGTVKLPFDGMIYRDGIWQASGCEIAEGVVLEPPIYLGSGVRIGNNSKLQGPVVVGAGSTVGSNTAIKRSLIWTQNVIGDYCILNGSILAQGVSISDGTKIGQGSIIGSGAIVDANNEIPENVAIMPGQRIPSGSILNLPIT